MLDRSTATCFDCEERDFVLWQLEPTDTEVWHQSSQHMLVWAGSGLSAGMRLGKGQRKVQTLSAHSPVAQERYLKSRGSCHQRVSCQEATKALLSLHKAPSQRAQRKTVPSHA